MERRILIVEDEEKLARFLELELSHEGYEVAKASQGREALEKALSEDFDLILLDIMLPEISGMEVLRRLRQEKEVPVILVTARDSVMDKVSGLDAGAVDYITKPFAIEELLARIRVALKLHVQSLPEQAMHGQTMHVQTMPGNQRGYEPQRGGSSKGGASSPEEGVITFGELRLDEKRHRFTYAGEEIALTSREFLMLKVMLENIDIVLSRDTLLEKVCGYDYLGETNIVDVYIRRLRQKIDEAHGVRLISTVRGVGYVIKSAGE